MKGTLFDPNTEELNLESYIRSACQGTNCCFCSDQISRIVDTTGELLEQNLDKWSVMQGHDISSLFVYYLKRKCKALQSIWADDYAIVDFEWRTRQVCLMDRMKQEEFYKTIKSWTASAG